MQDTQTHIKIGSVGKPHALDGGFFLIRKTSSQSLDFSPKKVLIKNQPYIVKKISQAQGRHVLKLENVQTREELHHIQNCDVFVEKQEIHLKKDEFLTSDLTQCLVYNKEDGLVGTIKQMINFGAQDNLDIQTSDGKAFYVPYSSKHIESVDLNNKKIVIFNYEDFMS